MTKGRHEMAMKTKELIDDMARFVMSDGGFSITDVMGSDPRLMTFLGYCGKLTKLALDSMDDLYDHYKSEEELNERILYELEELNKKVSYNETIIKELEKTVKSLEKKNDE